MEKHHSKVKNKHLESEKDFKVFKNKELRDREIVTWKDIEGPFLEPANISIYEKEMMKKRLSAKNFQ